MYTLLRPVTIPVGATGWSPRNGTVVVMYITLKDDYCMENSRKIQPDT
ncbi:MAG: hypothetical protein PHO79_04730 [Desulfoplanes sp.]|nr:hypothetical protein [Desulfoplanes sp.]MDD4649306.1 hypothetical protein [Desulfoplanes sp.]